MSQEVPHKALYEWVQEWADLLQPSALYWCDGSAQEYADLCRRLVAAGTLIPLDETRRPGSFLCRSDPGDVARVEDRTFICCEDPDDAGPTNNWVDPAKCAPNCSTCSKGPCGDGPLRRTLLHGTAR